VIGLGAIGGSLAWQSRLSGVRRVIGYSPRPVEGVQALKAGAVSEVAESPIHAARSAELVVLAVPPYATLDLLGPVASALEPGALLTDVCSVKAPIIERAVASGVGDRFAGSHPLAGTHQTGFPSASPERLRGCVVYICASGTAGGHLAAASLASYWKETLEADPILIDPQAHDRQLAWTSHLSQAAAYALAKVLADQGLGGVSFGPGAKDTTRLAASNPEMWADILLLNHTAVSDAVEQLRQALAELGQRISADDRAGLLQYFEVARRFRLGIDR
jgi:prephenate dehydrogenase